MTRIFSGLILAGGRGTRFGGPKAFARLPDGRTFLEACAGSLRNAGAEPVLATLPRGITGAIPQDLISRPVDPGIDMFSSLRLGLHRLLNFESWENVIILPVDHPLIEVRTFEILASSQNSSAAIATYRGHHGHPVRLSRNIAEEILRNSETGPTLRHILKKVDARDIEVDDPQTRANCNTPDTLEHALKLQMEIKKN